VAPRLELFAFRYRDPRTGKWVRARYRAEQEEIAARYAEWEIMVPAEIRDVDPEARAFTPAWVTAGRRSATLQRTTARSTAGNRRGQGVLLTVFLRRYITYCTRRRRYAAMNGAAQLYASLR